MSNSAQAKLRAVAVFVFPVIGLVGLLYQPYVNDLTDPAAVGAAVAAGPTRWLWSQTLQAAALVAAILAVVAIRIYLRDAGEDRWSFPAVPFVTIGAAVFIFLLGAGAVGGWVIVELGGSAGEVGQFFDEAGRFALPAFVIGGIAFSLGLLSLAAAVRRSGTLGDAAAWLVVIAVIVLVVAGFIPAGWADLVVGVAAVIAAWLIAYQMWQDASTASAPGVHAEPAS